MSLNIKKAIKEHGLEAREVAKRMGISPVGLSQHINGNPSVEVLERIATAIGCDVSELFEQPSGKVSGVIRVGEQIRVINSAEDLLMLAEELGKQSFLLEKTIKA